MKRIVDYHLLQWKLSRDRKPLLLRGARQVGKTHAARALGATYENFIEINLEHNERARIIFEKDLDAKRIALELSELSGKALENDKTLLFIDEIQQVPKALIALRYFYELMPELPVIAAGSLLDFAIEQVGMPVGRITQRYMHPMSFLEFLIALDHKIWAQAILKYSPSNPMSESLQTELMDLIPKYIAIGGMPNAVKKWTEHRHSKEVKTVHADILSSYEQDFEKYAKKNQIKYVSVLFENAMNQLGNKFMFRRVGEYQKRELEPALDLLVKAGLFHKIIRSAGQGIPIGAQADIDDFKIIFLDVGLSQFFLKLDISQWFIEPSSLFINKGEITEAFVGQEILAYSNPIIKEKLFYWHRESRNSQAEVDYLIQIKEKVIPIEVKSGTGSSLKSLFIFLESHPNSTYGIRIWAENYNKDAKIDSYPLFAIAKILYDADEDIRDAINFLIK